MPDPNMITVLRVLTDTLDKFLVPHGFPRGTDTGAVPPIYKYDDNGNATEAISELLRAQVRLAAGDSDSSGLERILLVMPSVTGHDPSSWVYIAYSFTQVYAHGHITPQEPPEQVPQGFEELRHDILKYSAHPDDENEGLEGLFIVFTEGRQV